MASFNLLATSSLLLKSLCVFRSCFFNLVDSSDILERVYLSPIKVFAPKIFEIIEGKYFLILIRLPISVFFISIDRNLNDLFLFNDFDLGFKETSSTNSFSVLDNDSTHLRLSWWLFFFRLIVIQMCKDICI
jgi:hypothetical protein